jgi:hypothetical protein
LPAAPQGDRPRAHFQALPINGKIVLRPPKAQTEQSQEAPGKNNVRPLKNRRDK